MIKTKIIAWLQSNSSDETKVKEIESILNDFSKQQTVRNPKGAGRPKGIETKILTIRVCAVIHDELKAIVKCKDDEFRRVNG